MKKVAKWTSRILSTLFLIILIFAIYSIVSSRISGGEPQIFGYQLKSVLSGSMEPGIKTGSIIAIKPTKEPSNYKEGDVITFKSVDNPNIVITHRVLEIQTLNSQIHYITKGDNNDTIDNKPIPASNVVGYYEGFTIPYIGYGIEFYNTAKGKIILLILPGVLLLGYALFSMWRTIASIEEKSEKETEETPKSV
jgi:signal peptidase I